MRDMMIYISISMKDGRLNTMNIYIRFCDGRKGEMKCMIKDDTSLDGCSERKLSMNANIYKSKRGYKLSYDQSFCGEKVIRDIRWLSRKRLMRELASSRDGAKVIVNI